MDERAAAPSLTPIPGGGIAPLTAAQDDSRIARVVIRCLGALLRLPDPLQDRLVLFGQRSTAPSKSAIGAIPVSTGVHGGVTTTWLAPELQTNGTIVFLHGGSYVAGPNGQQWTWLAEVQKRTGVAVAVVLYGMAPRRPFPAALDDAVAAVRDLRADGVLDDGRWILAGDSAGGGLALATAQALVGTGGPLPAGMMLTAPWVDLDLEHPDRPAPVDPTQATGRALLLWAARRYADGVRLDDPRLSPINGSMDGLPPVHIDVGTRDLFLADVRRLRAALEAAGVPVTAIEQEGAGHTYVHRTRTPEGEWAIRSQTTWVQRVLAGHASGDAHG